MENSYKSLGDFVVHRAAVDGFPIRHRIHLLRDKYGKKLLNINLYAASLWECFSFCLSRVTFTFVFLLSQ